MILFRKPKKAKRVYTVESLNQEKGISMSYKECQREKREYVVCLFLADRTIKNVFPLECDALEQMRKYRNLYKELKAK